MDSPTPVALNELVKIPGPDPVLFACIMRGLASIDAVDEA